jgi:hypothetical protein
MNTPELFKWASAGVALIPGLTIMLSNLGTPPGISGAFYGGLIEAIGALSLALLFLNKERIQKIPLPRINRLSIFFFLSFLILLLLYIFLFNIQVVYHPRYENSIFFPFWNSPMLQSLQNVAGSKYETIAMYGPQAVQDAIHSKPQLLQITLAIFILLYTATFECLILCFGFPGFKSSE